MKRTCKIQGFSLTEFSVVIVLIGLLLAAIVQGGHLIDNARLQAVISEVSEHKLSINSFYAKYDQYPGDFDEAVSFWGATTVDGDNNGAIEFINGNSVYEGYRAWQHLAYARMINEILVGTETNEAAVVGTDVPSSKSKGGYFFDYNQYELDNQTILVLGKPAATSASPILASGTLTPSQAYEIDNKIDDGEPKTGFVTGADGNGATAETCVEVAGAGTVDDFYQISASGMDCIMAFSIISE